MDIKTVVAVVLSVIVIIVSMVLQNLFFSRRAQEPVPVVESEETATLDQDLEIEEGDREYSTVSTQKDDGRVRVYEEEERYKREGQPRERTIVKETDFFRITFSTRDGTVQSIELKEFTNKDGTPVEMILPGESDHHPFSIHFGDYEVEAVDSVFYYKELDANRWEFSATFQSGSGDPFILRKTYTFLNAEYLMELKITIENTVNEFIDLDFDGISYTLGFGPQIGPIFSKLDGRNEYRQYHYYADGKRKELKPSGGIGAPEQRVTWTSIIGKYFTVICVPDATDYSIVYDTRPIVGLADRSSLYLSRPLIKSSKNVDVFRFYIGPKKRDVLLRYNDADNNSFGLADLHFEEVITTSIWIGWLANILKFFLELFYRIVPNYGVAIILLTLLIKLLFFPLTHRSYESTSKMQGLSAKVSAIREKYKGKSERMNQEIADLYKREGVNPLGGCLPLLLQLPIFIALFNLLSNHFELRGASFVQPWIVDLSSPESVWDFSPFAIPIVGWHELRLLPFIMLGTTFLQSKITQAPSSQGGQMKMLTYAMPIFFFFILYDMPSGLVLYWTMQNILSIGQQLIINRFMRKGKDGNDSKETGTTKPPKRR